MTAPPAKAGILERLGRATLEILAGFAGIAVFFVLLRVVTLVLEPHAGPWGEFTIPTLVLWGWGVTAVLAIAGGLVAFPRVKNPLLRGAIAGAQCGAGLTFLLVGSCGALEFWG